MKQLSDFFPQLNVDKLAEIDTFHQQLCRVLKDEVNKAVRDLEKQIATTESEIDRISLRMNELVQEDTLYTKKWNRREEASENNEG